MKNFDLSASCNTVEKNTTFVGNFVSESDFRIDGNFEGSIETKGKVVIGKNGSIQGTIVCNSADIEGKFTGTIQVKDLWYRIFYFKINSRVWSNFQCKIFNERTR